MQEKEFDILIQNYQDHEVVLAQGVWRMLWVEKDMLLFFQKDNQSWYFRKIESETLYRQIRESLLKGEIQARLLQPQSDTFALVVSPIHRNISQVSRMSPLGFFDHPHQSQ